MNAPRPLVSVLIPCYNAAKWVGEAIQSALTQDYTPIEVIAVDDGSSDGTADVIRTFGERVRFERLDHGGGNRARNHLMALSRGEWLQFLDADDLLTPRKISIQLEFACRQNPQPDLVYSPVMVRDQVSGSDWPIIVDPDLDVFCHFIRWTAFTTIGPLFRRASLLKAGGWNADQGRAPSPIPSYSFAGPSGVQPPLQQPAIGLTLDGPYSLPLRGTLAMSF
ncbi:MAG: glycosyltransferase family A protein, partial [Bryobacteraceae bacterium]|nr:glycosyltransferase family A protein [Bryobacteraceae bacterium]